MLSARSHGKLDSLLVFEIQGKIFESDGPKVVLSTSISSFPEEAKTRIKNGVDIDSRERWLLPEKFESLAAEKMDKRVPKHHTSSPLQYNRFGETTLKGRPG